MNNSVFFIIKLQKIKNWKIVSDYLFSRDNCIKVKSRNKKKKLSLGLVLSYITSKSICHLPVKGILVLKFHFHFFLAFTFQHVDRDFLNISYS